MGYLQNFFDQVFQQSPAFQSETDFVQISHDQLQMHLERAEYDDFRLTQAIRPSIHNTLRLGQGYRHDTYKDEETGVDIPVIMAAVSEENLFATFIELVSRLGPSVDVVLESSHDHDASGHIDYYREHIDTPVLVSALWDYEDLLTNDGCTGIAVLNPETPQEIQFDEHKLLIVYGSPLEQFEYLLESAGVQNNSQVQFVTESEHIHSTTESFQQKFQELKMRLGIDADAGHAELC